MTTPQHRAKIDGIADPFEDAGVVARRRDWQEDGPVWLAEDEDRLTKVCGWIGLVVGVGVAVVGYAWTLDAAFAVGLMTATAGLLTVLS